MRESSNRESEPPSIDKVALLDQLRERIAARLKSLKASQASAQAGAFHEENRQEHSKDTRAIEGAYLARGLAERVETTADMVAALAALEPRAFGDRDPIALGAVIALDKDGDEESLYFLVPCAGGEVLEIQDEIIHTITPQTPIGSTLVGRFADDEVRLELPRGNTTATIVRVT